MSDIFTLNDYIEKFPEIAEHIRQGLEEYGNELEEKEPSDATKSVMNIMVDVAKMHALQAIALGIQELVKKGN